MEDTKVLKLMKRTFPIARRVEEKIHRLSKFARFNHVTEAASAHAHFEDQVAGMLRDMRDVLAKEEAKIDEALRRMEVPYCDDEIPF